MMIADEGFEINFAVDSLGVAATATPKLAAKASKAPLSLLAFSRYELQVPAGSNASMLMSMSDLEKKSVSKCGETILGWYSLGREHWGCWRGSRRGEKAASTV